MGSTGHSFTDVEFTTLHPIVGFVNHKRDTQSVSINFGQRPFLYSGPEVYTNKYAEDYRQSEGGDTCLRTLFCNVTREFPSSACDFIDKIVGGNPTPARMFETNPDEPDSVKEAEEEVKAANESLRGKYSVVRLDDSDTFTGTVAKAKAQLAKDLETALKDVAENTATWPQSLSAWLLSLVRGYDGAEQLLLFFALSGTAQYTTGSSAILGSGRARGAATLRSRTRNQENQGWSFRERSKEGSHSPS